MDLPTYHATFDRFCEGIPQPDASIVEVGCGPGNITRYLLQQRPDFQILGIDVAPRMLELAQQNNPTARFQQGDARDLGKLLGPYQGMMVGFCLPYLSKEDVDGLIATAAKLLVQGGVLYLSTMEANYADSGWVGPDDDPSQGLYTFYHQGADLLQQLNRAGFSLVWEERFPIAEPYGPAKEDLVLIAQR